MVTRGFTGRGSGGDHDGRIPPGQHLVENFPVLTAGPTPRIETSDWKFTVKIGPKPIKVWTWAISFFMNASLQQIELLRKEWLKDA